MESFKGLAKLESDKNPIRIGSVQDAGRGEITVTSEVELASKIATNRTLGTFTVNLRQSNGRRFLVTNIAVYQTTLFDAPARTSLLLPGGQTPILADDGVPAELRSQRGNKSARPTTKTEATTKETKVIVLKYAKAADLSQTISQLLELNNPDFRVAVDVRTNRLLLHGTPDRLKEVIPLIEELDVPSAVKEALPMIEIPKDPDVPGAVKKTEPARENLFDTLPTQPAGETKP
jgi:hypothetical protein